MATHRTRAFPIAVSLVTLALLSAATPAQKWVEIESRRPDRAWNVWDTAADIAGQRMFFLAVEWPTSKHVLWMRDRHDTWTELGTFASEFVRFIAFDPVRQQVVGIGHEHLSSAGATVMTDIWHASGWTHRVPLPIAPLNAIDGVAARPCAFHPASQRIHVLISRVSTHNVALEWTGTAWIHVPTQRVPNAPFESPTRLVTSLHHGRLFGLFAETWSPPIRLRELIGDQWQATPGTPPIHPQVLGFDPRSGTLLVLETAHSPPTIMYEWNGLTWQPSLQLPVPTGGISLQSYYDAIHHAFVVLDFDPLTRRGRIWSRPAPGGGAGSFGAGCAGTAGVPTLAAANATPYPRIGQPFTFEVTNLPASAPAFLQIGFSKANWAGVTLPLDLGFFGMPGCTLRTSGEIGVPLVNGGGRATWSLPMPNEPGRTFYAQAIALDATANPRGLTLSNGWDSRIER